jgi:molybdate transport system regulatory protein
MSNPRLQISVILANGAIVGPKKIALLEAIAAKGSITAAARSLEISYRYAWRLVQSVNGSFSEPVVITAVGGSARGGAKLSDVGKRVVTAYRTAQIQARAASLDELRAIDEMGRQRTPDAMPTKTLRG